jgi:hypothetical protein
MSKTAVDYLFEKLWATPKDKFTWQSILQEAKKMEKEQIIDAYLSGKWDVNFRSIDSNQFYQETYGEK